jgi:hypothetical protein
MERGDDAKKSHHTLVPGHEHRGAAASEVTRYQRCRSTRASGHGKKRSGRTLYVDPTFVQRTAAGIRARQGLAL